MPAKLQFNPKNYLTEFLFSSKTRKNLTVHKGKVKVKIVCCCLDCRYAHASCSALFSGCNHNTGTKACKAISVCSASHCFCALLVPFILYRHPSASYRHLSRSSIKNGKSCGCPLHSFPLCSGFQMKFRLSQCIQTAAVRSCLPDQFFRAVRALLLQYPSASRYYAARPH